MEAIKKKLEVLYEKAIENNKVSIALDVVQQMILVELEIVRINNSSKEK